MRPSPPPAAAPPLVLIVDDVEDTRDIYAAFLRHRGFEAVVASDAQEALAIARARSPHVIVMDYALPGGDGLAATRQLKQDPRTRAIPVILLTGHTIKVTPAAAREAGASSFTTKPCLPEILEAEVQRLLTAASAEFRYVRGVA
jgi:two-component system, cell cycle response regulator DivK